jgi:Domain of unknown function (DUF1905)
MRFRTTIQQTGKNTTGIAVPDDVVAALGSGRRPAVTVTVNGYSYPSTVASMGGVSMVSLSAERRAEGGLVERLDDDGRQTQLIPSLPTASRSSRASRSATPLVCHRRRLRRLI